MRTDLTGWTSLLRRAGLTAGLLIGAAAWAAVPTVVPYPAPGGNTVAFSGTDAATGSGLGLSYGGFDASAYGDLYYGIGNYVGGTFVPGWPTLTFDRTPDVLLFDAAASQLANGMAVWSGTTIVYTTAAPRIAFTRFTLQVTDPTGTSALALTDPVALGMPAELGGVLDVTGPYRANFLFEASFSAVGGYAPANAFFDSVVNKTPGYTSQSSAGGAFYATPVPEPQPAALLMAGLATLALLTRRRAA